MGWPAEHNISKSTIQHIRRALGFQILWQGQFEISDDPLFAEKMLDIMGAYLNPRDFALALCVDKSRQVQSEMPSGLGYVEGLTIYYVLYQSTMLLTALDIASGQVLHRRQPSQRHREFLRFIF